MSRMSKLRKKLRKWVQFDGNAHCYGMYGFDVLLGVPVYPHPFLVQSNGTED